MAFFFIQRNKEKQFGLYATETSQSGVEFMVVHQISKLIQSMTLNLDAQDPNPNQGSVIDRQTPIFIFGKNIKELIYTHYDRRTIMAYQDNSKAGSMMTSTLVHEMVHDP